MSYEEKRKCQRCGEETFSVRVVPFMEDQPITDNPAASVPFYTAEICSPCLENLTEHKDLRRAFVQFLKKPAKKKP